MKPIQVTPKSNPERRVRYRSGETPVLKQKPNVETPKFSLERELEILEKLEKKDFNPEAGTEQWFTPSCPIKLPTHNQRNNLLVLHEMFGSVPMNLGKTPISVAVKNKLTKGVTLSDSDILDISLDKNQNVKRNLFHNGIFGNTMEVLPTFSSPTDSSEDDPVICDEGLTDVNGKDFKQFLTAVDKQTDVRWKLWEQKQMNEDVFTLLFNEIDLESKITDINESFEKLKMKDRLASIDVNKLLPSTFDKSANSLMCPSEEQLGVVNGLYAAKELFDYVAKLEKKISPMNFTENGIHEKLSSLESSMDMLQKLLNIEEKETGLIKELLVVKSKLFNCEEIGNDSKCSQGLTASTSPSRYYHDGSFERYDNSF